VMMQKYLLASPAWRSLSGVAMAGYLELGRRHDGANNGLLHLSARELAELKGCSINTALKALRELVDKGFTEITRNSGFNVKDRKRQAVEYRLTVYPCDVTRQLPSKAFMKWRPAPPEKQHFTDSYFESARTHILSPRKKSLKNLSPRTQNMSPWTPLFGNSRTQKMSHL